MNKFFVFLGLVFTRICAENETTLDVFAARCELLGGHLEKPTRCIIDLNSNEDTPLTASEQIDEIIKEYFQDRERGCQMMYGMSCSEWQLRKSPYKDADGNPLPGKWIDQKIDVEDLIFRGKCKDKLTGTTFVPLADEPIQPWAALRCDISDLRGDPSNPKKSRDMNPDFPIPKSKEEFNEKLREYLKKENEHCMKEYGMSCEEQLKRDGFPQKHCKTDVNCDVWKDPDCAQKHCDLEFEIKWDEVEVDWEDIESHPQYMPGEVKGPIPEGTVMDIPEGHEFLEPSCCLGDCIVEEEKEEFDYREPTGCFGHGKCTADEREDAYVEVLVEDVIVEEV